MARGLEYDFHALFHSTSLGWAEWRESALIFLLEWADSVGKISFFLGRRYATRLLLLSPFVGLSTLLWTCSFWREKCIQNEFTQGEMRRGVSVSLLEWYLKGKYINKWMKGSLCTWQESRGNISSFIWETATAPGLEKLMTLSWICTEYMTSLILWLHGFNYIGCFVTVYPKLLASFSFWFTKKHNFKKSILSTQCKKYFSFSFWQRSKIKI